MDGNIPHLLISYEEDIPSEIPETIANTLLHPDLDLIVESREKYRTFAAIEWLLPTAIAVFITKAYFDSFLKEMGKDHYHLLKKGIMSVWDMLISKARVVRVVSVGTKGKIKADSKYSLLFSVWSDLDDGRKVKFLFEEGLSKEEYETNVGLILQFLEAIHLGKSKIEDYLKISDVKKVGKTILIAFDKSENKLKLVNPLPKEKKL